ncbi:MAG: BREX system ATP-binding domain-containing protein [Desulfobaccales bacterium]
MSMSRLDSLIQDLTGPQPVIIDSFFESYGLIGNPFPPSRKIIPKIIHDQDDAIGKFAVLVKEVLAEKPNRRAMGILGGTGGGKTHFLRFCSWELGEFCKKHSRKFIFVEFQAGSGKVQEIVRESLRAADLLCRDEGAVDFITALVAAIVDNNDRNSILMHVQLDDLRIAITNLIKLKINNFKLGPYDFEKLRELFRRWLHGGTLSQTERKYLGVFSRISTASYAIRVLREVLTLARLLKIFEGMMLCLDEIETLFSLRPGQYQAFLQEIRYFYDEAVKDESGYSLLMLSASTSYGADLLRSVNYPVYQRLGFEADSKVELNPISGVVDAREFSLFYINYNHDAWREKNPDKNPINNPIDIIEEKEIEEAYRVALGVSDRKLKIEGKVNQAPLLEALYQKVEKKREESISPEILHNR